MHNYNQLIGGPCCPTLDFVIAFWTMVTFYTLLASLFCINNFVNCYDVTRGWDYFNYISFASLHHLAWLAWINLDNKIRKEIKNIGRIRRFLSSAVHPV
jgi:hypothetical protein